MAGSQMMFFTFMLSGVIQGCPLSGTLFAIAMDPVLTIMNKKIEQRDLGHVRACADDIGIVLRSLSSLSVSHPIFSATKLASGLDLKPTKCNIIPLGQMNNVTKQHIYQWLIDNLPEWKDFNALECAKYLGFYLDPGVSMHSYNAPFYKWACRAKEISSANIGPAASAFACNTEAASTLSYIGQLLLFPSTLFNQQDALMFSLLNIPYKGLGASLPFHLKTHTGGLSFTCIRTYNLAALSRTALVTVDVWHQHFNALTNYSHTCNLNQYMSGRLCPLHWRTDPIAVTLSHAANFFQEFMEWHMHTTRLLNQTTNLPKPQANIYKAMLPHIQHDSTCHNLELRATRIFGDPPPPLLTRFNWPNFLVKLTAAPPIPHIKIHVLKTLLNCWPTSHRMHEVLRRSCIFGCMHGPTTQSIHKDSIIHDSLCNVLWSYVFASLGERPLTCNLITAIATHNFEAIALASFVYGALKQNPKSSNHAIIFDACNALARKHAMSHLPRDPRTG